MRTVTKFLFVAALGAALPLYAANAGNPAAGKLVYDTNCSNCHGPDGTPVLQGAPNFTKGERMEKPDAQLLVSMNNGLNIMPAWKGVLTDVQMADALAFARTLRK
ncbi:MAG: c-type cytochrome [Alphaproteobacteria bacterium]